MTAEPPMNEKQVHTSARLMLTGAADVIEEYALSKHFDWERDQTILRRIANDASMLNVILMLAKEEGKKDGTQA